MELPGKFLGEEVQESEEVVQEKQPLPKPDKLEDLQVEMVDPLVSIFNAVRKEIAYQSSEGVILDPMTAHLVSSECLGIVSRRMLDLAGNKSSLGAEFDEAYVMAMVKMISANVSALRTYLDSHETDFE